jgi:hypothetical protein
MRASREPLATAGDIDEVTDAKNLHPLVGAT